MNATSIDTNRYIKEGINFVLDLPKKGERFFLPPWKDNGFKYTYSKDNSKYGIKFAHDVAQLAGFNPLLNRQVEEFEYAEDVGTKLAKETESSGRGNLGRLNPDLCFTVRDSQKSQVKTGRDLKNDICVHFEMQSSGSERDICVRSMNYDGIQWRGKALEIPETGISIPVLRSDSGCSEDGLPFRIFNIQRVNTQDSGELHERMGVLLHVGKRRGTENIESAVGRINKVWHDWEAGPFGPGFQGLVVWKQLRQRVIALSLLDEFTDGEFNEYITDEEVRSEFMDMKIEKGNMDKFQQDKYMREELAYYGKVAEEREAKGRAQGAVLTTINNAVNWGLDEEKLKRGLALAWQNHPGFEEVMAETAEKELESRQAGLNNKQEEVVRTFMKKMQNIANMQRES